MDAACAEVAQAYEQELSELAAAAKDADMTLDEYIRLLSPDERPLGYRLRDDSDG